MSKELDPRVSAAVEVFKKIERTEKRLEKFNRELAKRLSSIPDELRGQYNDATAYPQEEDLV